MLNPTVAFETTTKVGPTRTSENGEGEVLVSRISSPYLSANHVAPPTTTDEKVPLHHSSGVVGFSKKEKNERIN